MIAPPPPKKSKMLVETAACLECGSRRFFEAGGQDVCEHGHVYDSAGDAERLKAAGIAAGFGLRFTK